MFQVKSRGWDDRIFDRVITATGDRYGKKTENHASPPTVNLMEEMIRQARKKYFHALSRLEQGLKSIFLSVSPLRMDFSEAMGIFDSCLKDRHRPARGKNVRSILWMKVMDDGSGLLKDPETTREAFVSVALPLEQHPSILSAIARWSDGRGRPVDKMIGTRLAEIAQDPLIRHWPWMTWWKMTRDRDKKYKFLQQGIYHYSREWANLDNKAWRPIIAEHFREYPDDRERMLADWSARLQRLRHKWWDEKVCGTWRVLALIGTAAHEPQLHEILMRKLRTQEPMSLLYTLGEWEPKNPEIRADLKAVLRKRMTCLQRLAANHKLWARLLENILKRLDGIFVPAEPSARAEKELTKSLRQLDSHEFWKWQEAMEDIIRLCEAGHGVESTPAWNELERKLEALLRQEKDANIFLPAALLAVRQGCRLQQLPPEKLWSILLEREARSEPGTWLATGIPLVRQSLLIREFEYWLERETPRWEKEASGKKMAANRGSGIDDATLWLRRLRFLIHAFPEDHLAVGVGGGADADRLAIRSRIWKDIWKTVSKSAGMDNLFSRRKKLEFRCPPGGFRGGLPAWSPPALFKPPSFESTSPPSGQACPHRFPAGFEQLK